MEEQKVSFDVAKLAMNKGFKEYTSSGYAVNGDIYLHQGGQESVITGGNYYEGRNYKGNKFLCSRPTQSLLQKWLRDSKNIHINIEILTKGNEIIYSYDLVYVLETLHVKINKLSFNSYEEALEAALLESLNLIQYE